MTRTNREVQTFFLAHPPLHVLGEASRLLQKGHALPEMFQALFSSEGQKGYAREAGSTQKAPYGIRAQVFRLLSGCSTS